MFFSIGNSTTTKNIHEKQLYEIPKIIHQTWKTNDIPDEWKDFQENIKTIFWDFEYKLWTDADNRQLIADKFEWFLPIYDNYEKNIERADAVRYFILYEYGGIYMDLDYSVRKNFYDELSLNKINVVECYRNRGSLSNFLMASPPRMELWKQVFYQLVQNRHFSYTLKSTGPSMLTDSLLCENIHILPYRLYNPPNPNINQLYKIFSLGTMYRSYDFSLWNKSYGNHHNSESWRSEEILTFIKRYNILLISITLSMFFIWK